MPCSECKVSPEVYGGGYMPKFVHSLHISIATHEIVNMK